MQTSFTTIIEHDELDARLGDDDVAVVDTRFNLMDVDAGRAAYVEAHVPGAVYAHLGDDLSGPPLTDRGRHPLPSVEALAATFSRLGIDADVQVVAYDSADGSVAARLWWLLRYMGHDAVAVLNGGWRAWQAAGHAVRAGEERRSPRTFRGTPRREWLVITEQVPRAARLVDARDPKRYRGEHEPLDPVAGHIPGAVNHFFRENVDAEGRLREPRELAARLGETLGGVSPEETVFYCGSGVTACHDLLALAHAGLAPGKLYAGSWSDWCADPARPVVTGEEPGGTRQGG